MMGMNLAQFIAEKGFKVLFRTSDKNRAEQTFARLTEELQKNSARMLGNDQNGNNNHFDIKLVLDDQDFSQADIILEATEEKISTKISLFKQLEPLVKSDCLLATITSSLPITSMASELRSHLTMIGAHFFHPVNKMPLVEIALPDNNYIVENGLEDKYRQANAKLLQLIGRLGKTPVSVKDSPCFLVNRLLASYLLDAARLVEAGVPLNWIDKAAVDFGMPLGPLTLLDEIGFDLALSIAKTLAEKFPRRTVLPLVLAKVEALGIKGKRFGCGVYQWDSNGKRLGVNPRLIEELKLVESDGAPDEAESTRIASALILPMIDEAACCLEEKLVRRAREVDIASVLGLGFPAFRGGVLKYADSLGLNNVVEKLNNIYAQSAPKDK